MLRSGITSSIRLAGQVRRYHTWPVIHQQTVAEHTWQVMLVYWQIWGPLPATVQAHILWHDAGEIAVGDIPFPVKANNPLIKGRLDALESEAVIKMGGPDDLELTAGQRRRVKICDLVEMHEFGLHELMLGNRYAEPIIRDTLNAVRRLLEEATPGDSDKVLAYVSLLRERYVDVTPPLGY